MTYVKLVYKLRTKPTKPITTTTGTFQTTCPHLQTSNSNQLPQTCYIYCLTDLLQVLEVNFYAQTDFNFNNRKEYSSVYVLTEFCLSEFGTVQFIQIFIIFEKLVGFIVEHVRKVLNKLSQHSHCLYPNKWKK